MKYKSLFIVVLFACLSTSLLVFSGAGSSGAMYGLKLCYNVVIPSLFPFTVFSLIIFECGFFEKLKLRFGSKNNFEEISVFLLSCIGGFPVGAKLINNLYKRKGINKKNAELMLGYCVSSGPSFIILSVGSQILNNILIGYVLFFANLLSNLIILVVVQKFKTNDIIINTEKTPNKNFAEIFVNSTYDAVLAMLNICAYVVLFSTIINVINSIFENSIFKTVLLSLLEITNGVSLNTNIYSIAFLLGFGGLCVHLQIISMCKDIKPKYSNFFFFRIIHGFLLFILTKIIIAVFGINVSALSGALNATYKFSEISTVFGLCLIALSVAFIISVNRKINNF